MQIIDFGPVRRRIEGLFINIERELERKANENLGHRPLNQATTFLRVSTLSMYNSYQAVVWLGSDVEETGNRPKKALLAIPSITRTMIDNLFTVVFMFDQEQGGFLQKYIWYAKSSYRDAWEELERYKKDLPQHSEYINFFEKELEKYAAGLREHLQVPKEELSDPSKLRYWPTITQVLGPKYQLSPECRKFLSWLYDWTYREVSQIAHHTAWGISKIGLFLLKESLNAERQARIEGDGMERFRSGHIANAIVALLCFASEINRHYRLNHNDVLLEIWQYLNDIPVIQEAWDVRYRQVLLPQPS